MTVTYMDDLSRVRVSQAIPAGATTKVDVQRTTDGIRWDWVRGGESAPAVASTTFTIDDYEFPVGVAVTYRILRRSSGGTLLGTENPGSLTVSLAEFWLKSPTRPFLNRSVTIRSVSDIGRRSRSGIFDIEGRSFPVAVTDVRSSRQFTIDVRTHTVSEGEEIDLVLASGEVLYLQVPDDCPLAGVHPPTVYAAVGDTSESLLGLDGGRVFSLPLTEVAPPHHSIVGVTYTWQSVINDFATWADVIAAEASWSSLQELIGDPDDVVVP